MRTTLVVFSLAFVVAGAQAQTAVQAWVQRYKGPANPDEYVNAIAVDRNGNVFVTGISGGMTTIAYSAAGVPLWTNHYGPSAVGNAIATDDSGDAYVTGYVINLPSPYDDYVTVKYSSAGVPLWTNRYDGFGGGDEAIALALDQRANVVVTGYSTGVNPDYATIKYSPVGVPLWTNRYNGPANSDDRARSVATDTNGNIFVTGYSQGASPYATYDYATIKYSGDGIGLWTNRYHGPTRFRDSAARGIALDANGNVFVTGYSAGSSSWYDYATIAYSNSGLPLWTNRYHGPGNADDYGLAIALGANGSVIVSGYSSGSGSGYDFATIAYSTAGVPLWTNRYNGLANGDDKVKGLAVDRCGNVFVAGYSTNVGGYEFATVAYSSEGQPWWTNRFSSSANGLDWATAIAVDLSGHVFVGGNSWNGTNYDFATIKYSVSIPLSSMITDSQLVLSWTNAALGCSNLSFGLQTAPAINGPFTNVAGATSPHTNGLSAAQQFFRLISN